MQDRNVVWSVEQVLEQEEDLYRTFVIRIIRAVLRSADCVSLMKNTGVLDAGGFCIGLVSLQCSIQIGFKYRGSFHSHSGLVRSLPSPGLVLLLLFAATGNFSFTQTIGLFIG